MRSVFSYFTPDILPIGFWHFAFNYRGSLCKINPFLEEERKDGEKSIF